MSSKRDKSQKSGGQSGPKLVKTSTTTSTAKISTVSEEFAKKTVHLLSIHSYFQCDILLLVCLWLSFSHLWIQMINVYGKIYYLWNWRQVGASFVGIVNNFVPYSVERPRRGFKELLLALLSVERRKEMFWKDLWSLAECDEVNNVFSNALLIFFAFLPIDGDSAPFFYSMKTIVHWIFSVILLNIRTSDGIIRISRFLQFISTRFSIRWLRHPSVIYLLELIVSTLFTLTSIFFFAIISPISNTTSKTGQLLLVFDTVAEVALSWITAILPVFLLLMYQRHRSQLHYHLQQLVHDVSISDNKRTHKLTFMFAFHRRLMQYVIIVWLDIVKLDLHSIATSQHQFSSLTQASLMCIFLSTVMNIWLLRNMSANEVEGVRFESTVVTGIAAAALGITFALSSLASRQHSTSTAISTMSGNRSIPSLSSNSSGGGGSMEKGQSSPLRGTAPVSYPSFATLDIKANEFQSLSQMLTSSHTYQNYAIYSRLNAGRNGATSDSREFGLSSQDSSPSHPAFSYRMRQSSDDQQQYPEIGLSANPQPNNHNQQQQPAAGTKNVRKELQKARSHERKA